MTFVNSLLTVFLASSAVLSLAAATTVRLQPTSDVSLEHRYENFGRDGILLVGRPKKQDPQHALLKFDMSSVPQGTEIVSASVSAQSSLACVCPTPVTLT